MIRVVAWTVGLFAVGWVVCGLFAGPLVEPLVLLALGTTLFLVAGRGAAPARVGAAARESQAIETTTRAAR